MKPPLKRSGRAAAPPPCARCDALCCRYLATEIDAPLTKREVDDIRWYLLHRGVSVFIDAEDRWFLSFGSVGRELAENGRCRDYARRPRLCRDHGRQDGSCEAYGPLHRVRFDSPEDFEAWLDRQGLDWRFRRA